MAQYMLLLHQVPDYNADLPREKMLEMTKRYMAWADGLRQKGRMVGGEKLAAGGVRHIKVKDGVIEDARFKTFGCGSAIASSSPATTSYQYQPPSMNGLSVSSKVNRVGWSSDVDSAATRCEWPLGSAPDRRRTGCW